MTAIVPIVEETGDLEAPGDLAELVVCPVTRRCVADGSEAQDVGYIASGVHTMSSDVPISIQNSVLTPLTLS